MGARDWRDWLLDFITRGKVPTPPSTLQAEMQTDDSIHCAQEARARLNAELERFNELANQIRDEDWRPRHD